MNQRTTWLVGWVTVLAAGCLAVGCAQGSGMKTTLPVLSLSRNLSVSPPTISLAAASASLAAGRGCAISPRCG
jgi:hypothetical protein